MNRIDELSADTIGTYDPPLRLIYKDVTAQVENNVLRILQDCGIEVDTEELLKALEYDRNQYEKGYNDGLNATKKIIQPENQFDIIYTLVKESLNGCVNQCMAESIAKTVTEHLVRNDVVIRSGKEGYEP